MTDLPKGWDDRKSIYELTDDEIRAAAAFRGGKFIGPVEEVPADQSEPATDGTVHRRKCMLYEWECENGHRFTSSLEYVLLGGGWCPECGYDRVYTESTAGNKFISAVLSSRCRG